MNDKELIAEARRLEENYGGRYEIMTHMSALADALSVRQPTESDREAKAEALKEWQSGNKMRHYSEFYTSWEDGYEAGFSRAAVPDAATEGDYLEGLEEGIKIGRAERDAALAVLERIREAVSGHPECDRYEEGDVISCGWKSAYASVVAALDWAPEPEPDNYDKCDAEVYSWDHYRPEQIDSYWIRCTLIGKHDEHEDSHTGLKWRFGLPVEGESK